MSHETPFLLEKIECPICKTVNEFKTVRVGAYSENGRDTDFCPREIKWRHPRYENHNPLVYFTTTCGNCFYTREFNNSFKEWKNDNDFITNRLITIKGKHLEKLAVADSVIRAMGEAVDLEHHANASAILKLLLAIYDEQLAERTSNLDIGRFYLRVAWVFRNLNKIENPGPALAKDQLREVLRQFDNVKEAIKKSQDELDIFSRHLFSHFDSERLTAEIKSRISSFRGKLTPELEIVKQGLTDQSAKVTGFAVLLDEYRAAVLGLGDSGTTQAFGQYGSFTDFLLSLKSRWDGIVTTEREALEKAVHFYKVAFNEGRDIAPGNQQIQAAYLIAELSRRVGAHDDARQYFNGTIRHGQEYISQNHQDPSRTALARKVLELAIEQGRVNMEALKATLGS